MGAVSEITFRKPYRTPLLGIFFLLLAISLPSCSGNGVNVAGGGIGGTGKSRGTITGFGSVIVNGVAFDTSGSEIVVDDNPGSESDLGVGMVANVRGTFSSDGITGDAEKIEAENEVQGAISGFGPEPESFTVLSQKILVDSGTVFANVTDLAGLGVNDIVEAHGFRNRFGDIRATRVELLSGPGQEDEVKGTITGKNLSTGTFNIGALVVNFVIRNPEIDPFGATFENLDPVEVHGVLNNSTNEFEATRIEREDIEDAEFDPKEGEEFEVEGFVTGFTDISSNFFVDGIEVQLAPDVSFEGGLPADLRNDIIVEAEGKIIAGGVLLVREIEFEESEDEGESDPQITGDLLYNFLVNSPGIATVKSRRAGGGTIFATPDLSINITYAFVVKT